jgi:hypothetical protein
LQRVERNLSQQLRGPIEITGPSRRDGPSSSTRHEIGEA